MPFDAHQARRELRRAIPILKQHGLRQSAKFCAEQLIGLSGDGIPATNQPPPAPSRAQQTLALLERGEPSDAFLLAGTFFDLGEYARAAVALTESSDRGAPLPAAAPDDAAAPRDVFLWAYALYLAGEKRKEETVAETKDTSAKSRVGNPYAAGLRDVLVARRRRGQLQGLGAYALGIVLKELARGRAPLPTPLGPGLDDDGDEKVEEEDDSRDARAALAEATETFPWNWSAWLDLAAVDAKDAPTASLPMDEDQAARQAARDDGGALSRDDGPAGASEDLVRACARAHNDIERQRCEAALATLRRCHGCSQSAWVLAAEALAHYARRDFDQARDCFEALRERDPFRLDDLDVYSNVLYVQEARAELSRLAHAATRCEKYRPETCCVVGNYYSLKAQHERAVLYFRRALRLDRTCLSAWTLMGHEYIEMKNTAAAIEAYRRAVDVNGRDYRAWYGLGQTYEILNMYFYALYYYRKAAVLRPRDARMWIAIAQCYEKLNRDDDAIKGYERAAQHDDAEGHALLKLARLHRGRASHDEAFACYSHYARLHADTDAADLGDATAEALLYLATAHKKSERYDEAQTCLGKLLDYPGPEKLEAQAMLREIRALVDPASSVPADVMGDL